MSPSQALRASSLLRTAAVFAVAILAGSTVLSMTGIPAAAIIGLGILSGPVSGWVLAAGEGALVRALPLLAIVTLLCAIPLALAVSLRSRSALVVAGILWLAAGYLFTVAIWI